MSEWIHRNGFFNTLIAGIKRTYRDALLPMLQRPRQLQTAALCYRRENGKIRVLLVSSRGTKRWIIPKGWPMRGKTVHEAAAIEAWEEAGVRSEPTAHRRLGSYVYDKIGTGGLPVSVETLVFAIEVTALEDDFPEAGERRRRWVDPAEAAEMVAEPGLKKIFANFAMSAER